ncbi:MAG TPA: hypothetical protein VEC99_18340, partial [Clostridia bacterium]|nr:hypothetical protein [Clostridia bacterium]
VPSPYGKGPGGPILVITSAANPFTEYYAEILLTEGLNAFALQDIACVSSATLAEHQVAILGEMPLTPEQVHMLSEWVLEGGNLIAMRPDKQLAGLLGLQDAGGAISEGYLLVDAAAGPGAGIVNQTMQFHGTADRYSLKEARSVANLYVNARTPTTSPAVSLRDVGSQGGQAAAFTFDLARSVVLTRQGNPAWAGQERDGKPPLRSNDLFYGPAKFDPQPDWVDMSKVEIPQADEQQRLLANLIIQMNSDKNLLPRFWYFPHDHKAVLIMTGDDHARKGTKDRFENELSLSPPNASLADWETIRSSSYTYLYRAMTASEANAYNAAGFEIGLHLDTGCADYTRDSLDEFFTRQLKKWKARYPDLPPPTTHRAHCIAWSGYTTMPEVEFLHGIRLDVNYYFWPSNWVANRPGLFTGSGMAMRFASAQGNVIDVYQAATQMTDESGQPYPSTADTLLDRALGPEGYYGAFVANMHTDRAKPPEWNAIVSSALNRGVPVITSRQLLTWLDARNSSSFESVAWGSNQLTFRIKADANAHGLRGMVPVPSGYEVSVVKHNGNPVSYVVNVVKGIEYVVFPALTGSYEVSFNQT